MSLSMDFDENAIDALCVEFEVNFQTEDVNDNTIDEKKLKKIAKKRLKIKRRIKDIENAQPAMNNVHLPAFGSTEIEQLKEIFEIVDKDKDGLIISSELRYALKTLGFKTKKADTAAAMASMKGEMNFTAFLKFVHRKHEEVSAKEDMMRAFVQFNRSGSGKISSSDLKWVCQEVNMKLTDQEIHELLLEADPTGHDLVSLQDFEAIIVKSGIYTK